MEKIIEHIQSPLVCPIDKGQLIDKNEFWECAKCSTKYKVTNGIPNLIPEDAETKSKQIR